jgi:uncharacterized protein DUF4239
MRSLQTLVRLLPAVIGSAALSIVGLCVVRSLVPIEVLRPSNDVVGNYLQTIGGIYAVLLAFVVFVVWQQFNDARASIEREASEVVDLFRIVQGLPNEIRDGVHARLHDYICAVLDHEWAVMARKRGAIESEQAVELLDATWQELRCFEPLSERHKALHAQALTNFNELSNARTSRLSSSQLRIPGPLRYLLYIGAIVLIASMWLCAVDSFTVHAIITGALAGAVSHVLYVIEDLDDAFSGDWQVSKDAFVRAQAFMKRCIIETCAT